MQLCGLPDVVLRRVLRASCLPSPSPGEPKGNLWMLAISRRLRRLALPVVYRTAYYLCFEDPTANGGTGGSMVVNTSMGLIATVGCADLVRAAVVTIACARETHAVLLFAAREIRNAASNWPKVETLMVKVMHRGSRYRDIASMPTRKRDDVCGAAEALASLFPRVRCLALYGTGEEAMANIYYRHLAGHYAEQLEELRCENSFALPQDVRFQSLRRAQITCGARSDYPFPRINPATLEDLRVNEAPSYLDLGTFSTSDDSPDIVFPELKTIVLNYFDGHSRRNMRVASRGRRPWRFHFPRVRDISVDCKWGRCSFIENAVFPVAVNSFSVTGNAALLTAVAANSLPTTQSLELEVSMHSNGTPSTFVAINTILSSMRPSKAVSLRILDDDLPVLPSDITFTGLTELGIITPTSVRTIVGLVQKLPQLTFLQVSDYTIDDIPPEVAVPAPDASELLQPFDTRLSVLALARYGEHANTDQDRRIWQYMLLRLPSLKGAYLEGVSREAFGRFVAKYSRRYPHLSRITLDND